MPNNTPKLALSATEETELRRLLLRFTESNATGHSCEDETWNRIVDTFPQIAFEAVILRTTGSVVEVYLTQRPASDKNYANQHHCPGTFFRRLETQQAVAQRLSVRELGSATITKFELCGSFVVLDSRGTTHSQVFLCWIEGEPTGGVWLDAQLVLGKTIANIDLVASHYQIIQCALSKYSHS